MTVTIASSPSPVTSTADVTLTATSDRTRPTRSLHARALRRGAAIAALGVAALGLSAVPAAAHDQLIASVPSEGESVDVVPGEIVLTYNANIQDLGAATVVTGPDGEVETDEPVVSGTDLTVTLPDALPAGDYAVDWRVVSSDGHPISGTVTFSASTDSGPAEPEPAQPASPTVTETETGGTAEPSATESSATESSPTADASSTQETTSAEDATDEAANTEADAGAPWGIILAAVGVLAAVSAAVVLMVRRSRSNSGE